MYDIIIIGAGLAGLHCARLLGSSGCKVLLIDRKRGVADRVSTTGIFVRKTLEDFELPEDCLGPAIRHVALYSPAGRRLELESPFNEFRIGNMGALYERWLGEARALGVEWRGACRLAALERGEGHSVLELDSNGSRRKVQARFVIGADGAASPAAGYLGLSSNREWIVGVEDVYSGVPLTGDPRLHCFLDPRFAPGYLAWVVNDGRETHVGVGGYARRYNPVEALAGFTSQIASEFELRAGNLLERRGGRIPVGGVLPRIANRWGLLAGDAAGAVSPLTAGGLDPCMRLSSLAAVVARQYLKTGDSTALLAYDGRGFRARFRSRIFLRRILSAIHTARQMERMFQILAAPPLRPLAWKVFFGRGSFPEVGVSPIGIPVSGV